MIGQQHLQLVLGVRPGAACWCVCLQQGLLELLMWMCWCNSNGICSWHWAGSCC